METTIKFLTIGTLILAFSTISCRKSKKGGDNQGGNSAPTEDAGEPGDNSGAEGEYFSAGSLALGFNAIGTDFDLSGYEPPAVEIPDVAAAVNNAMAGSLAISTGENGLSLRSTRSSDSIPDCSVSKGLYDQFLSYYCLLGATNKNESYIDRLNEVSSRTTQANERLAESGALCVYEPRTPITREAGDIEITQELSCYAPYGSTDTDGVAFGKSDDTFWLRETMGHLGAEIKLGDDGEPEKTDIWYKRLDGQGTGMLTHVVAIGESSVEVASVGYGLNAKFTCGIQALIDKASERVRMRAIWNDEGGGLQDNENGCQTETEVVYQCYDVSAAGLGNELNGGECDSLVFTTPILVIGEVNVEAMTNLPVGYIQVTQEEIDAFGDNTQVQTKSLMKMTIPDPIHMVSKRLFNASAANTVDGLVADINSQTEQIEDQYTANPPQCLVDVPDSYNITDPLDLNLPMWLSCFDKSGPYWSGFGSVNGSRFLAKVASESNDMTLYRFGADETVDGWVVRASQGNPEDRSLTSFAVKSDSVEITAIDNSDNELKHLNCGFHVKKSGSKMYVTSTFVEYDCTLDEMREFCLDIQDDTFAYVPIETCQESGLDIFSISSLQKSMLGHERFGELIDAVTLADTNTETPIATNMAPPLAEIEVASDESAESGKVDIIPLRPNGRNIVKISGGRTNYGKNCRHTNPIGNPALTAVHEVSLGISQIDLGALQASLATGEAFVSFNFDISTTTVGNGATLTWDYAVNVALVDSSGATLAERNITSIEEGSYVISSIFTGQTLDASMKLRVSTSGSAEIDCPSENSGQKHISAGLSHVRLSY